MTRLRYVLQTSGTECNWLLADPFQCDLPGWFVQLGKRHSTGPGTVLEVRSAFIEQGPSNPSGDQPSDERAMIAGEAGGANTDSEHATETGNERGTNAGSDGSTSAAYESATDQLPQPAVIQASAELARAYAAAGAPDRNAPVPEIVRAREAQIQRDRQLLNAMPSEADRLEARRRGIGPMLPHLALTSNAPTDDDIDAARAVYEKIKKERLAKEEAEKEGEEEEQSEKTKTEAGEHFSTAIRLAQADMMCRS